MHILLSEVLPLRVAVNPGFGTLRGRDRGLAHGFGPYPTVLLLQPPVLLVLTMGAAPGHLPQGLILPVGTRSKEEDGPWEVPPSLSPGPGRLIRHATHPETSIRALLNVTRWSYLASHFPRLLLGWGGLNRWCCIRQGGRLLPLSEGYLLPLLGGRLPA